MDTMTSTKKSSFYDTDLTNQLRDAALSRLARRQAMDGDKGSKKGGQGALAGGIVGAILSGLATGNPMPGYAIGSQLGSAAGRGDMDMETGVQLAPSILKMFMTPSA